MEQRPLVVGDHRGCHLNLRWSSRSRADVFDPAPGHRLMGGIETTITNDYDRAGIVERRPSGYSGREAMRILKRRPSCGVVKE